MDGTYYVATEPLALATPVGRLYRKQVIYSGTFFKGSDKIVVTPERIKEWASETNRFLSNGNEVPVPIDHTIDPEKRRGSVVTFSVEKDSKGRDSLYALMELNPGHESLAQSTNVSIFTMGRKHKDGAGNEYNDIVRHVALTDYPVVPDLEKFQLALSETPNQNDEAVPMDELLALLGLQREDGASDEDVMKAIVTKVTELLKPKEGEANGNTEVAKPPLMAGQQGQGSQGNGVVKETTTREFKPVSASLVSMMTDARATKVDTLVREGKITPAQAAKVKEQFCKPDHCRLMLSQNEDAIPDNFDSTLAVLAMSEAQLPNGREHSRHQTGTLSLSEQASPKSVLVADAQRRAGK